MKKILLALFLPVFFGGLWVYYHRFEKKPIQNQNEKIEVGVQANRIFQSDLMVHFPPESKVEIFQGKQVLGGVVPHHLVAAASLTEFFSALSKSAVPPQTIIIIGPNHEEKGKGRIITGKYSWETSFGLLKSQGELVEKLVENKMAILDEELLSSEHAIYSLTPFIKYFLPEARIVPLVVSGTLSLEESQALGGKLAELVDEETVLVGSIDFSHYLSSEDSKRKDQETLQAIRTRDYSLIASFGDDHLDSPPSLLAVLSFLEKKAVNYAWEVVRQTDSGSILQKPNAPGTSHFELVFFRDN